MFFLLIRLIKGADSHRKNHWLISEYDTNFAPSWRLFCEHAVAYNLPMISLTNRRVLHVWIALLAILFGALAPTVSRAIAANPRYDTVEVCSASGYKAFKIPKDGTSPSSKVSIDHCAFCANHAGTHGLPGISSVNTPLIVGRDFYPPLFYSAPRLMHAWSAANPRAPPFVA